METEKEERELVRQVLSDDQKAYVEALITHEHITAQHKSGATADAKLEEARRIVDEVNEKKLKCFTKRTINAKKMILFHF